MELIKSIKSVTTKIYKIPEKRVYHTEEILIKKHIHEEEKRKKEKRSNDVSSKVEENRIEISALEKSGDSKSDSNAAANGEESNDYDQNGSLAESEEEIYRDYGTRLSISQK